MRIRIGHRLFIGFLLTAAVVLTLVTLLTRWNFERGFLEYVNESETESLSYFAATVGQAYAEDGGWHALDDDVGRWLDLMEPPALENTGESGLVRASGGDAAVVSRDPLAISPRIAILDASGNRLFGPAPSEEALQVQPIFHDGKVVGSMHLNPMETLASDLDSRFAEQQTSWIVGSAAAALALAAILAFLFTRQMVSPISDLTRGTQALTAGQFSERINVNSTDELGELADDFNTLAETLERHQQSQRQWIADISHELRTPLAVLRGELHGIEDGVREFDESTRRTLDTEVDRLTKLVDDMYDLSVSDIGALRYKKRTDFVVDALRETLDVFEGRIADAGLTLECSLPCETATAIIDRVRLGQLFTNLLENSIRYTDSGGTIRVTCANSDTNVTIDIEDSAPSVPDDQLPHLFERLYRVDSSRRRSTGGAGLGLAICENIAHAHSGSIKASRSSLGGLRVTLTLPLAAASGA